MTTTNELLKRAYQLGYQRATHEKTALNVRPAINALTSGSHTVSSFLKRLWESKPSQFSRMLVGGKPEMAHRIFGRFTEPASQALGFGTFGAGMNTLMGDESKPWYQRAATGFAGGAAGGLGWHYGAQAARGAVRRLANTKSMQTVAPNLMSRVRATVGPKGSEGKTFGEIWRGLRGAPLGERAKQLGTYALAGAPVAAGAWYGSAGAEGGVNKLLDSRNDIPVRAFQTVQGIGNQVLGATPAQYGLAGQYGAVPDMTIQRVKRAAAQLLPKPIPNPVASRARGDLGSIGASPKGVSAGKAMGTSSGVSSGVGGGAGGAGGGTRS